MYYQLYVDSERRVADLVAPLDFQALATVTPACPDWSVRDVLAHLAGAAASFGTPSFAGVGTDAWTAEHVESRRNASAAGEPALVAQASLFEFWRGAFGRRGDAQLRGWVVRGDAAAFAEQLPVFGPRTTDLIESA